MADRTLSLLVKFAALDRLTGPTRTMLGGTRSLSRGLAATRQELAGLRRAEARLAAFKGLETKCRSTADKLELARQKTAALRTEIANTENPTKRMTNALARAEREEAKLTERHEDQGRQLQELVQKLEAAGVGIEGLGDHEVDLSSRIRDATSRLEEQTAALEANEAAKAQVDRAFQRGERLRNAGYGMIGTGLAVGVPLVAAGVSASDFQSTMTDIAQKADITRERAAELGREFDRMAPRVAQLPAALAEGADTLLGLGASLPNTMASIEPIARGATAYHAEVNELAAASFATQQNLNVAARDTARTLDIMATAGKAGAFELRDMATYFPALTAGASALGQTGPAAVADLAAALQIARRGAGDAATAANNVQNLLNKVNTRDTVQNFRAMGVDITRQLREGMRQGKSPMEIIAEQAQRATRGDLSKLSYLFGDAQVQAALRPLIQNLADYRRIRADALRASGTVERDFNERMRDSAEVFRQNMSRLTAFAHLIGNALLPLFNAFMEKVGAIADAVSAWAAEHPQLVAWLARAAAIVAVLLVVVGSFVVALGTILGPLFLLKFFSLKAWAKVLLLGRGLKWVGGVLLWVARVALVGLLRGIWALALGMFSAGSMLARNPVILAISLIVIAIGVAAYLIWKHWDKIKEAFGNVVRWLTPIWNIIVRAVSVGAALFIIPIRLLIGALRIAWNVIASVFRWAWGVLTGIWNGIVAGATWLGNAIMVPLNGLAGLVRGAWEGICSAFEWAWNKLKTIWDGMIDALGRLLTKLYEVGNFLGSRGANAIPQHIQEQMRAIANQRDEAERSGRSIADGVAVGIRSQIPQVQAAMIALASVTGTTFRDELQIRSPSRVFAGYGRNITDGLAIGVDSGGASPVARMVALAGRLAAALAVGGATPAMAGGLPAGGTAGAGGGLRSAGGNTYHFQIHQQPGQSAQELAAAIRAELDRRDRADAAAARSSYRDD